MPDRPALAPLFLAGLDAAWRDEIATPGLEALLWERLEEARRAWPGVALPPEVFAAYLAARLPKPKDPAQPFERVHTADLYLACGCSRGAPAALAAFEAAFAKELSQGLARLSDAELRPEDFLQQLRQKLFAAQKDAPPKIAEYSGQGFLQNWVRVTVARSYLDIARGRKRRKIEVGGEQEALLEHSAGQDVELDFLKRQYRAEFRQAFAEGLASLTSGERNLLRQSVIFGLSIDQLGAVYAIHRATAARRLEKAREGLLNATREALMRRLSVDGQELNSIMRLIRSNLEVSLSRLLGPDEEP
jgi:RNA polymerase sigma-70 factor, ECF subfamily